MASIHQETDDMARLRASVADTQLGPAMALFGVLWSEDPACTVSAAPDQVAHARHAHALPIAGGLVQAAMDLVWRTAPPGSGVEALRMTGHGMVNMTAPMVATTPAGEFWGHVAGAAEAPANEDAPAPLDPSDGVYQQLAGAVDQGVTYLMGQAAEHGADPGAVVAGVVMALVRHTAATITPPATARAIFHALLPAINKAAEQFAAPNLDS